MQIAMEVRRVLSKKPNSIKLKHFRIPFKSSTEKRPRMDKEMETKVAKSRWGAILGLFGLGKDKANGK